MVRELGEKNLIYQIRQYRMKRRVHYFPEVGSTNAAAKELCEKGKGAGVLVVANCQTAGRGRLGRDFASPPDTGVYLSAVYTLSGAEKNLDMLSSRAGLAVRDRL